MRAKPDAPSLPAAQSKPRLLDLFCGAGGASVGYSRAGFEVIGVDVRDQPRYPFEFVQDDARSFVLDHVLTRYWPKSYGEFVAVHAAPLWWRWTQQARAAGTADNHPDDVGATLDLLSTIGLPFILEVGTLSPQEAVTICGVSCGLRVTRHMRFVTNWPLMVPPCSHAHGGAADGLYIPFRGSYHKEPGWRNTPHTRKAWRDAAGLGWMTSGEADLASPPAYTEFIGCQLQHHLQGVAACAMRQPTRL